MDAGREYPTAFVEALTRDRWLAAPIPAEYGGLGLGLTETSVVFEEIHRSGANATHGHAQVYMMGALLRHGSEAQKRAYLPRLTAGQLRLQAFGVTEPDAGSETTRIETTAERRGDRYVVNGRKLFISRIEHSDLMLLLARTTPYDQLDGQDPRAEPLHRRAGRAGPGRRDRGPAADGDVQQPHDRAGRSATSRCRPRTWSARRAWASAT